MRKAKEMKGMKDVRKGYEHSAGPMKPPFSILGKKPKKVKK